MRGQKRSQPPLQASSSTAGKQGHQNSVAQSRFIYKTTEGEVQTVQEAVLNKDLAHKYYGSASINGQTTERQQN
jgi:hypothetical protein